MKPYNVLTTIFLLLLATRVIAGIRPSFYLEACSWNATHVAVVTEGEKIDGRLDVLESWKGDLQPGQTIFVPELATFKEKDSRLVRKPFWEKSEGPQEYVTGTRMIVFLKEITGTAEGAGADTVGTRHWEAASEPEMNVSVLWIEGDQSYAFVQVINPGDSILIHYGKSEGEIKTAHFNVDGTHQLLNQAIRIKDSGARAIALGPFTESELYFARNAAFEGLRACGKAALPVLRKIINDPAKLELHGDAIEALTEVGGHLVGEELTAVVRDELGFWRATAPGLKKGWWNETEEPERESLRNHYTRAYAALVGLQKVRYTGCRPVVLEFRDFWRSLPQLEDQSGLDRMSDAGNEVLGNLK